MVSRRNFLTITAIIFVMLFMFQLSAVVKERWSNWGVNQYADEPNADLPAQDAFSLESVQNDTTKKYVIFIGNTQDNAAGSTVKQWCTYTKRRLVERKSLVDLKLDKGAAPEVVLLDPGYVDWSRDTATLTSLANSGIDFVFCSLPSFHVVSGSEALRNLLGITQVSAEDVGLKGIKLFGGFLLGGEEVYAADDSDHQEQKNQDLNLHVPWYSVSSGTKIYMVGMLDKQKYAKVKNEYLPAIIWRNSIGNSRIFVVNGDYLSSNTGIGILDAMMAELHPYEIYPVVNAQSIVALNYPVLAEENSGEMEKRYSRSSKSVIRDIMWPCLVTLTDKMQQKITCMVAPQLDYEDRSEPDAKQLEYFIRMIREQKGELGLSGTQTSAVPLKSKLEADYGVIHSRLPDYKVTAFYADNLQAKEIAGQLDTPMLGNVKTVLQDYDAHGAIASYAAEDVLALKATVNGYSHTFSEDLRVKSLQTALGYSTIMADMERVVYPQGNDDEWENLYDDFSRFTTTYWRKFSAFDQTTLSESGSRMRAFLAMDYSDSKSADTVTLRVKNLNGEGWFLLRTHGESVAGIDGGTCQKVENDAYLILVRQSTVSIQLQEESAPFIHN